MLTANHDLKRLMMMLGPLAALSAGLVAWFFGWSIPACWTIVVTVWCVVWWIFEPVPIPITSCLPIAILPLTGALPMSEVSTAYGNPLIMLLLGGFMLATALEKSGAHRQLALATIRTIGDSNRRLVFGFMVAAALLSMWISNTATTLMLLPIALAILQGTRDRRLALPLMLGIAYAASIGGIGSPIGTPPNLIFMQVYVENGQPPIAFLEWMSWGLPVVLLMVPLACLWLTRSLRGAGHIELPEAESWSPAQKRVMVVFAFTALAWITRISPYGGWSSWFDLPDARDSHVALLSVILMSTIPDGKGSRLLDWKTASKIPWGMLLLFAGGIVIAKAFVSSGISTALGDLLAGISTWHTILIIATIALTVTFMTEMTSNIATTTLLMPILAATALGANLDPKLLMLPAVMSSSCAFMLPVATAPNMIAYSTQRFRITDMIREGFVLNLIGAAIITLVCSLLL